MYNRKKPPELPQDFVYLNQTLQLTCGSRNSSLDTATALRGGQSGVLIPVSERHFPCPATSKPNLGPTQYPYSRVSGFFFTAKQLGCEVTHSPKCSAEVQNEWSYTSTPYTYSRRAQGQIFN